MAYDKSFRITFTPAIGQYAGQEITRTFVADDAKTAKANCARIAPGATIKSVVREAEK